MIFDVAIALLLGFVVIMLRRTQMPPGLRSVLAVMFGFFSFLLAMTLCARTAARLLHITAGHALPPAYFTANAVYSALAALLGGWVTGDIAPTGQQLKHGAGLALLLVVLSALSVVHPAAGQPAWSRVVLAIVPPLMALVGSLLTRRRVRI